jgi:hypothetical protein
MTQEEPKTVVKPYKVTVHFRGGSLNAVTVTIKCPYCKKEHVHGFGTGYRSPHCVPEVSGAEDYYLDCSEFSAKVREDDPR